MEPTLEELKDILVTMCEGRGTRLTIVHDHLTKCNRYHKTRFCNVGNDRMFVTITASDVRVGKHELCTLATVHVYFVNENARVNPNWDKVREYELVLTEPYIVPLDAQLVLDWPVVTHTNGALTYKINPSTYLAVEDTTWLKHGRWNGGHVEVTDTSTEPHKMAVDVAALLKTYSAPEGNFDDYVTGVSKLAFNNKITAICTPQITFIRESTSETFHDYDVYAVIASDEYIVIPVISPCPKLDTPPVIVDNGTRIMFGDGSFWSLATFLLAMTIEPVNKALPDD